jgi:CelD/BcsL family acetyltransferase involved in cellulose biosynthesis
LDIRNGRLGANVGSSERRGGGGPDTSLNVAELVGAGKRRSGSPGTSALPGRLRVMDVAGPAALTESAGWVDHVHAACGVSRLAGRRWLEAWCSAFTEWEPWVLTLLLGDEPLAVAPLARRRGRWGFEVVSMGAGELNDSPLAARDELGATGLSASIAHALAELGSRWSMRLLQLPTASGLTRALEEHLGLSRLAAGAPRPVLRLPADPGHRILTANTRSALAKARNRISREGRELQVGWIAEWPHIQDVLGELVQIHRARDMELRGMTLLDDPPQADFYDQVLTRHAGEWRLLAVRIDGSLAGYALCLVDRRTLRVWDNRVSPAWRRYSAGLIANAEVVTSAARDPALDEVDWGCGIQRYKTSMSNHLVESETLLAWSSGLLRTGQDLRRHLPSPGRLRGGG